MVGGIDGAFHISFLFVANVNVDDGKLKANVNRFDNDNVWNADNRHRLVVQQHTIFSSLNVGSFLNEQTSASEYCEFTSQFLPFLEEIAGRINFISSFTFNAFLPATKHSTDFL